MVKFDLENDEGYCHSRDNDNDKNGGISWMRRSLKQRFSNILMSDKKGDCASPDDLATYFSHHYLSFSKSSFVCEKLHL